MRQRRELGDRLVRFLEDANMAADAHVNLRLPSAWVARADRLIEEVQNDQNLVAIVGTTKRSAILRMAIQRGLDVLEREYPNAVAKPGKKSKK